jgi:hypothetical protein
VRIGKGQVAANGADVAYPHVGHVAGDRGDQRAARSHEWRALDGAVRRRGADDESRPVVDDGVEPSNTLDVDEMARAQQSLFHQQE